MNTATLLAKYSLAGAVNTIVGYAVIFACMQAGVGPEMSNGFGYAVGLVIGFVQLRHWVFQPSRSLAGDWVRFLCMFALAYSLNFATLKTLLVIGANPYLAQLAACFIYVLVSFLLNSRFVFRRREAQRGKEPAPVESTRAGLTGTPHSTLPH